MKAVIFWPEAPPAQTAFADAAAVKRSVLDEVLAGLRRWDDPAVVALVAAKDLDKVIVDPLAVEVVDRAPTLDELVRIATDSSPGIGNEGPDRLLGSMAMNLEIRDPIHRHWLTMAVAGAAFMADDADEREPWDFWARNEPLPSVDDRARVRAVFRAPWLAFRITRASWVPCFEVDARWLPREVPRVVGPVQPRDGELWCARVIPTRGGSVAALAFPVRGLAWRPAVTTLVRWARFQDSRFSKEMVLRRYGHHLVRMARPL